MGITNPRNVQWNGNVFILQLEAATGRNLQRAGAVYMALCKKAVSVPNTGVTRIRKRNTKAGRKGSQYTIYPHSSKEGEPPRVRTSFGRSMITMQYLPLKKDPRVRVGVRTNAKYMIFLELGTKRIAPRPWLVNTFMKNRKLIGAYAAGAIP